MVSLRNFVEDLQEERRENRSRFTKAFSLVLAALFLALSIWSITI